MTHYKPKFNSSDVKIVEHKTAYQGHFRIEKYLLQYRLFAGGWSKPFMREVFKPGHAAAALLFDPILNKMVLIEQIRIGSLEHPKGPWLLEVVAGIVEEGETPNQTIKRESKEEADLYPLALIPICEYWPSPGASAEKITLYCARVDASAPEGIHGLANENEDIRVWILEVAEVYELLEGRQFYNAPTIIALQWFKLHEEEIRRQWL